eukprot:6189480-Pleurochrysis_carterae.AAC.1
MDAAAKADSGAMASVSGASDTVLQEALDAAAAKVGSGKKAYIANYMFPEGRTCSGDKAVLEALCDIVVKKGAKQAKMLAVSGAFHTPYMAKASEALAKALAEAEVTMPSIKARLLPPRGTGADLAIRLCSRRVAMGAAGRRDERAFSLRVLPSRTAFETPHPFAHFRVPDSTARTLRSVRAPQVYSNVTGKPYSSVEEIKELLKRQMLEPVKWEQARSRSASKQAASCGSAACRDSLPISLAVLHFGRQQRSLVRCRVSAPCTQGRRPSRLTVRRFNASKPSAAHSVGIYRVPVYMLPGAVSYAHCKAHNRRNSDCTVSRDAPAKQELSHIAPRLACSRLQGVAFARPLPVVGDKRW